jgi:hypothetical protein
MYVGMRGDHSGYMKGALDQIRIYDYAVSDIGIQELYGSGGPSSAMGASWGAIKALYK